MDEHATRDMRGLESPYEDMTDNQVIEQARTLYRQLQTVPRWSADNDKLLRAWGAVCSEMGRRGITDTVTEGGSVDVVFLGRVSS